MSYDYRYSQRTTTQPRRRYAPPPPPSSRSHHSLLGYWVPVIVTGTIAIGGLAAWIWSERSERDEDDYPHDKPPRPPTGVGAPYPTQGSQPYPGPPPPGQGSYQGPPPGQQPGNYQGPPPGQQQGPPPRPPPGGEASSYYNETTQSRSTTDVNLEQRQQDDGTWYGRMTGAIKRTPSPQQFFDSASKQVMGGMAAAGAALGSIMEDSDEHHDGSRRQTRSGDRRTEREEKEGFSDHERWSEEADERHRVGAVEKESEKRAESARNVRDEKGKGRARKAVAVVVSADTAADVDDQEGVGYRTEHASILSHLPAQHSSDTTDLFVLIYSPTLKTLPPLNYQPATSTSAAGDSSFSTPAVTPGSELTSISPRIAPANTSFTPPSSQFEALYTQALSLVSSSTHILPFTTSEGYVHILRHLAPQLVYVSDAMAGDEGESVSQLKGWVGHTILVAGDDGVGGLADTETEDEGRDDGEERRRERWYEHSAFVGLGKPVEVVDAVRVGEDWAKRVGGRD